MSLPVPKYAIGDTVYRGSIESTAAQHPCPDCHDSRQWKAISPVGVEHTVSCPRCGGGYWSLGGADVPSLKYQSWEPSVHRLTIGSIEAKTHDYDGAPAIKYMCRETGIGSGSVYDESDLYPDEAGALSHATLMAQLKNSEIQTKPEFLAQHKFSGLTMKEALLKEARDSVWNAWYAYRTLREDMQDWLENTKLSDEDKEAFEDKLNWDKNYREHPEPELLAALTALADNIAKLDEEGLAEHAEPMRAARAAIAKAKGGAA